MACVCNSYALYSNLLHLPDCHKIISVGFSRRCCCGDIWWWSDSGSRFLFACLLAFSGRCNFLHSQSGGFLLIQIYKEASNKLNSIFCSFCSCVFTISVSTQSVSVLVLILVLVSIHQGLAASGILDCTARDSESHKCIKAVISCNILPASVGLSADLLTGVVLCCYRPSPSSLPTLNWPPRNHHLPFLRRTSVLLLLISLHPPTSTPELPAPASLHILLLTYCSTQRFQKGAWWNRSSIYCWCAQQSGQRCLVFAVRSLQSCQ